LRDVQPSPVQVQLGAAAAKLLRVQSVNKPAAGGPAGNSNSSSAKDAPGIIAGSLTQQQAADIHLGRLCGAGSFGRVYRCGSLTNSLTESLINQQQRFVCEEYTRRLTSSAVKS
jgi:hypothetical protein